MTINSGLRAYLKKTLPTGWESTEPTRFPMSPRKKVAILDAPSWLYKVNLNNPNQPPPTLNDLIAMYTRFVQDFLHDSGDTFILLFDRTTPLAKYVNQKSDIPETPLNMKNDHFESWANYFSDFIAERNTKDLEYMLSTIAAPGRKEPSPYDYKLPFEWHRLLGNRGFKEYVSWVICNAVFHFAVIPEGKTLVVLGPKGSNDERGYEKQRVGSTLVPLEAKYNFCMNEADFSIPYLVNQFVTHTCVVYSIDGDVMINLLFNRELYISISVNGDVYYDGDLYLVSKFNMSESSCEYIDVNKMWIAVRQYMATIRTRKNETVRCPVQVFCTLCILCGNDYVENFPRIGPAYLFSGFKELVKSGVTVFILGTDIDSGLLKVYASSYFKLMAYSYSALWTNQPLPDISDCQKVINWILPLLRKRDQKAAEKFGIEFVRNVVANLAWNLTYMIDSASGSKIQSPLKLTESGHSAFGYRSDCILSSCCTYMVERPKDTSLSLFQRPF